MTYQIQFTTKSNTIKSFTVTVAKLPKRFVAMSQGYSDSGPDLPTSLKNLAKKIAHTKNLDINKVKFYTVK